MYLRVCGCVCKGVCVCVCACSCAFYPIWLIWATASSTAGSRAFLVRGFVVLVLVATRGSMAALQGI